MNEILTLTDAGALKAILGAAERKALVAQLDDENQVIYGTAQYIGRWLPQNQVDYQAEARADVRDLFLIVQAHGRMGWLIRDLIFRHRDGRFIVDFDLAAFEAGGGQAAVTDAALIREARGWIADSFSDVDAADLSDAEVRQGVTDHYAGGWAQFVRDQG